MLVEICIDRLDSARAAQAGGAQRIEVCGALAVGGVTPSAGLIAQCVELGAIDVMVMIRPHPSGFVYDSPDVTTMLRDIRTAAQLGARGVVFGALDAQGRVDRDLCRRLLEAARPLSVTFHRAFDLVRDPLAALDTLLDLGCDRLLTSGQAARASDGAGLIRTLVERAAGRLAIVAGAGITSQNAGELVRQTGVQEVHASASRIPAPTGHEWPGMVLPARVTCAAEVRRIVAALQGEA